MQAQALLAAQQAGPPTGAKTRWPSICRRWGRCQDVSNHGQLLQQIACTCAMSGMLQAKIIAWQLCFWCFCRRSTSAVLAVLAVQSDWQAVCEAALAASAVCSSSATRPKRSSITLSQPPAWSISNRTCDGHKVSLMCWSWGIHSDLHGNLHISCLHGSYCCSRQKWTQFVSSICKITLQCR